jgi:hypothetical protein
MKKVTPTRFCIDCLNCKVSKKSTEGFKICFCARKKKLKLIEVHWQEQKACKKFNDMNVESRRLLRLTALERI